MTAVANPGAENVAEDVSSPAAAKERTAVVNSSFIANIKIPVSLLGHHEFHFRRLCCCQLVSERVYVHVHTYTYKQM
jgi:hypothetical protein